MAKTEKEELDKKKKSFQELFDLPQNLKDYLKTEIPKPEFTALAKKMREVERRLGLVALERSDEIRGLIVTILSDTNMLLLGPPGIAKSHLIRAWSLLTQNAQFFEWLMTKFTQPDELFGPFSIKGLKEDKFKRNGKNRLQEANIAFLDEIWKANSGVLNSLLTLANERVFFDDGKRLKVPLFSIIGASNEIPEESDGLSALFDRFSMKFIAKPLCEEASLNSMLMLQPLEEMIPEAIITMDEIREAKKEISTIDHIMANKFLIEIRRRLISEKIKVSDRKWKMCIPVLKTVAWLNGRTTVREPDFDILQHVLWTNPEDRVPIYTAILDIVNPVKKRIVELYEESVDLFSNLSTISKKDVDQQLKTGVELLSKVRANRSEMKKLISQLAKVDVSGDNNLVTVIETLESSDMAKKMDMREMCKILQTMDSMYNQLFRCIQDGEEIF